MPKPWASCPHPLGIGCPRLEHRVPKPWSFLILCGLTILVNQDCVEDLLCDEMALELAWEGSRYGDLCRIARHKNTDSYWGTNYGSLWLRDKLAFKNLSIDLSNPENWFMPFK